MSFKITKQTARKFLLQKQLLWPPQKLRGRNGITRVFNTLRAIQYDPQNPCGRNVDLVLQARVDNIHISDYYKWLYQQNKGIEFYDKELCVLPIEDLPLCRKHYKASRKSRYDLFVSKHKKELDQLLNKIRRAGPICSRDIQDSRKIEVFWTHAQWGRVALETLWKNGKLVITNRQNGQKYYDLPRKVYGNKFQWTKKEYGSPRASPWYQCCTLQRSDIPRSKASRDENLIHPRTSAGCSVRFAKRDKDNLHPEQILRRIQSVGLLTISGTGQGWLGLGTGREIKPLLERMIKNNLLTEIEVQGIPGNYVINTHDTKLLKQLKKSSIKKVVFLGPLDNLLWDRKMIKDIFDFEYKWEAYTPKKDRKFGHYVLPILYGDRFIGRIEPFLHKDKTLEIKSCWLEKGIKTSYTLKKAFNEYLQRFQKYLNAARITWKGRGNCAKSLCRNTLVGPTYC